MSSAAPQARRTPGPPPGAAVAARTRALLEGPITPTLLRLAWPNVLVSVVQASVGFIEVYFVGRLGTEALTGVSLVFPAVMLMQMMSAGAMGGGISAAIARALGRGDRALADALVLHALAIAGALGLLFCVIVLASGPWLYRTLGGTGAALDAAVTYSNICFGGILLLWIANALASVLRGTGNMLVPSLVFCAGALLLLVLSPALIFGWGPFPALGVAGAGVAVLVYYGLACAVLGGYLLAGRSIVRLRRTAPRSRLFGDILRVGLVAAVIAVTTNLAIALVTALTGRFGSAAIAGYAMGARLEYLLIPLVFGLGAPLVALVGTNVGAGRLDRALRAAWTGGAIAFVVTAAIGLVAAMVPHLWIGLFSTDPAVIDAGSRYLVVAGPCYGFFGLGMALYFASQGAGRMRWPLAAGLVRLGVIAAAGPLAVSAFGLPGLYAVVAAGLVIFGGINTAAVALGSWRGAASR